MADVEVTRVGMVATVEVCRPPANFFDADVLCAIADACEELQASTWCRAVVLCSRGKHFCAGADFASTSLSTDRDQAAADIYDQGLRLFDLEIPIVAAIQGVAAGGGLGLACVADFRIASPLSIFHANFSSLGFHHGFGLSVSLPRIVGLQQASELLMLAPRVTGEQAFALGLVDRLTAPGEERGGALALAQSIAQQAPLAIRSIRATLRADLTLGVRAAVAHELAEQSWLWRTEDSKIGIAASIARNPPSFTGS